METLRIPSHASPNVPPEVGRQWSLGDAKDGGKIDRWADEGMRTVESRRGGRLEQNEGLGRREEVER